MLTIDQIIAALNVVDDSYFPRVALEEALAQQEVITPVLLDIIKTLPMIQNLLRTHLLLSIVSIFLRNLGKKELIQSLCNILDSLDLKTNP